MTASNLREKLLTPQHQPFRFPDRGEVPLLPYVSHNAFSAYLQRRDDPKAAFFALVEESLADGAVLGTLSEADCDALARFYAGTMECEAAYDAARREQGGFDALRTAFASTSLWKSYLEDERRFSASLPWTIAPVVQDVVRQMTALDDTLRRLRHDPIPDQLLRAPALALPVRSSLLDLRSQVLLPKFDAITSLATVATRSADTWGALLREHRRAEEAVRAFAEQTRWVSRVPEQIARMQRLVAPVPDISLALHRASERLREVGLVPGALAEANAAIARSIDVVVGTNDYFSQDRALVSPILRPALPPEATPEEREAFEAAADSTASAEVLLHDEAAGLVLVGDEAARLVADLVSAQMDEKLRPYANVLHRLERLSRAGTFGELLAAFATVAARDFWKSLWQKPGDTYLPSPERIAQAFLGFYLHGHGNGLAFVGREIGNGDGYVDLLVNFLGQDKVVELKMLGGGYGVGHAKGGLDQLDAYMQNYRSPEAFLVVFDGRKSQKGEQLSASYTLPHGRVHVVTVRVYFDAPSQ